jgi:hypothetical protein
LKVCVNTNNTSRAADLLFFNAVNTGQHVNPVLNAEIIQTMLKTEKCREGWSPIIRGWKHRFKPAEGLGMYD